MNVKQAAYKAAQESMVNIANEIVQLKCYDVRTTSCGVTMDGT